MPWVDPKASAQEAFDKLRFSTWQEAKLIPCLRYLRGNKHLRPPTEWMAVFPREIEILHRRAVVALHACCSQLNTPRVIKHIQKLYQP